MLEKCSRTILTTISVLELKFRLFPTKESNKLSKDKIARRVVEAKSPLYDRKCKSLACFFLPAKKICEFCCFCFLANFAKLRSLTFVAKTFHHFSFFSESPKKLVLLFFISNFFAKKT